MALPRPKYSYLLVVFLAAAAQGCRTEPQLPNTQFAEANVNGTTLKYDVTGAGHPLVLVHGGFVDRRMWDDQLPVFARKYKVIRMDLRGFEGSPTPEAPFSYVDDLHELLVQLNTGPVYLLGLSLGAMVATEFATNHPEMVDALILAGAPLRGIQTEDPEGSQKKMINVIRTFRRGALDSTVALTLELPVFNPAKENPEVREKMATMV
ncbi:MAG: alpha/beta hydrolase, partial [Rhodothermales bacterium]